MAHTLHTPTTSHSTSALTPSLLHTPPPHPWPCHTSQPSHPHCFTLHLLTRGPVTPLSPHTLTASHSTSSPVALSHLSALTLSALTPSLLHTPPPHPWPCHTSQPSHPHTLTASHSTSHPVAPTPFSPHPQHMLTPSQLHTSHSHVPDRLTPYSTCSSCLEDYEGWSKSISVTLILAKITLFCVGNTKIKWCMSK